MKTAAEELKPIALGMSQNLLPIVSRNRAGTRTDFTTTLLFAGAIVLFVILLIKKILK